MDFSIPADLQAYLKKIDDFIEREIVPLQRQDDNERFFDYRREWARTDFENGGLPREEWIALMAEARRRADEAGFYRFAMPKEFGGQDGSNVWMTVIREHLATKGLGLHYDQQNEHSVVGNNPFLVMFRDFGSPAQKEEFISGMLKGTRRVTFGLTEPRHGSDATHMETRAVPETRDGVEGWLINGEKMWTSGFNHATHSCLFARTSGKDGSARGLTCFLVKADAPGVQVEEYLWTFNMPTDHPRVSFTNVWVPATDIFGPPEGGLALAQGFVHENRIRQAAGSLGAAVYCIEESVKYARVRRPFGKSLSENQAIQWPLIELHTQCEMLRQLIRKTAWEMDQMTHPEVEKKISDKVSMCNYWANRLCCEAADRAIQTHGGIGYSRHKPFEHIYRHHRRYRITEGTEEIQMRKVGAYLFGYMGPRKEWMSKLTDADVDYRSPLSPPSVPRKFAR
ncbi:MAG: acyl-CoA dehydrogenase family protein [Alphaproteobacteria bacterium]|nr:acyl-CoA dehydrogenase family protein [Alphaproteobacteria bacterium]